jgi:hypothetical protein
VNGGFTQGGFLIFDRDMFIIFDQGIAAYSNDCEFGVGHVVS